MPKVMFVVHGMGDNLPTWSRPIVTLLDELLAQYAGFGGSNTPFTDRVHVEELTYDAVFDKHIENWGQHADKLEQFSRETGIRLNRTLTLLGGGTLSHDANAFFWETLLDPILYRASSIVRDQVRALVIAQLLEKWNWYLKNNLGAEPVEVSILCHSQGTIVMSDVLAIVGENRSGETGGFKAGTQSIHLMFAVANVSQLGPRPLVDIDSLTTVVRPTTAPKAKPPTRNYVSNFVNVRHKFDPFCWWQRFDPSGWNAGYKLIEDLDHFHFAFPHAFTHYLRHPRVHIELFRQLFGVAAISSDVEALALEKFQQVLPPGTCGRAISELRDSLLQLRSLTPASDSLDDFLVNGLAVYEAARRAMSRCRDLSFSEDNL